MIFFWTILYGLAYTLPVMYIRNAWATSLSMSLYILLLTLWLLRTGKSAYVRLQPLQSRNLSDFLPLLLLPVCNLPLVTSPPSVILLMVCVSIAEEILFRGVLLRFFQKRGNLQTLVITAIIFALFHGVNLLHGDNVIAVLLQILCAAGTGFLYGAITIKCGSILPAMAGHILTNITGIGSMAGPLELLLCTEVSTLWGIRIYKSIDTQQT